MTPPAATAAARLRPAAVRLEVEPVVAPEVEPEVTRNYSPPRIRKGRGGSGGGSLRPADRRISGPARRVPAGRLIAEEVAVLEVATAPRLKSTIVERVELPSLNLGRFFRRPALSVPNPASVVEAVRTAPDHALTDYLVASRVWIGVVTALAAGLVFIQVQLLHTNAGIGTNIQRVTSLQRQNADLRTAVSGLSSDQRIVAEAQRMGFVEPPVGSTRFAAYRTGDSNRALGVLGTKVTDGGMTDASLTTDRPGSQSIDQRASSTSSADNSGNDSAAQTDSSQASSAGQGEAVSQSADRTTGAAAVDGGSSPQSG